MSVLVINDTRVDRHHGCSSVMAAIEALLTSNGLGPVRFWPAHTEWRGDADFDAALADARLVVINGEGTIHHDRLAGRRLLEAGAHAHAAGIPVALINAGWESNGPDFVAMLGHFDLLSARDSRSAALMAKGGANVRIVPDLSIWHARTQMMPPDAVDRIGIGFTDNVDRLKSLALERLRQACGGETMAIVHGEANVRGWARFLREGLGLRQDISHPLRLGSLLRLRDRLWRQGSADTDDFLARTAALELLVSGRFHACTLALATGTPVISQSSNTTKIASLFHDAGLESWRGELALDCAAVYSAREYGWSALERTALDIYLAYAVSEAECLFVDLATLARQ